MKKQHIIIVRDPIIFLTKSAMSTKSLPKKGVGGLEFQDLAAPSVFMCLPNVYQGNFWGRISWIFPLIFPFL